MVLRQAGDVGQAGERRRGLVGREVGGRTQIRHGPGEVEDVLGLDAELPGALADPVQLIDGDRDLLGHLPEAGGESGELSLGGVDRFPDAGEAGFEIGCGLDRGAADEQQREGDGLGQGGARLRHLGADRLPPLAGLLELRGGDVEALGELIVED